MAETITQGAPTAIPTPGATEQMVSAVTFTLYAPRKKRVCLIGDFNGWKTEAGVMAEVSDGFWSIQRPLTVGQHYYQFVVDDVAICDPYAREISWPGGVEIRNEQPQAVIRVGLPPFDWQHDRWQRPHFTDLVIYEIGIGDFSAEGRFTGVTDKLDYLKDLGINAVELMPVSEAAVEEEWGYQPTYFFAANHEYGTNNDLKVLVDQAHSRGIAVILDMVLAQTAHTHPFCLLYPIEESPWYGHGVGGDNIFGLPNFDHRKEATRNFMRDIQNFWFNEFHVDGYRYDYAVMIGVEGDYGLPFLGRQARVTRPDAYLIAEYLPEDPKTISGITEFNATWHAGSSYALKTLLAHKEDFNGYGWNRFEEAIRAFDPQASGYTAASHMITYLESHDEARLVHELMDAGFDGEAARRKMALAATILLTAPGVPMIYHGQEFGETAPRSVNERNPLRWELLATKGGQGLIEHYKRLLSLRSNQPCARSENFSFDAIDSDGKCVAYHRWDEEGNEIVVAANFNTEPRTLKVPFPNVGPWRDILIGIRVEVNQKGQTFDIELKPSEAAVFVKA